MRLNIYSQELITDGETGFTAVEVVEQVANTGLVYSAVRLFLHSSERLHHPPADDDRSALTFWLPKTAARREVLAQTFEVMANMIRASRPEAGLD